MSTSPQTATIGEWKAVIAVEHDSLADGREVHDVTFDPDRAPFPLLDRSVGHQNPAVIGELRTIERVPIDDTVGSSLIVGSGVFYDNPEARHLAARTIDSFTKDISVDDRIEELGSNTGESLLCMQATSGPDSHHYMANGKPVIHRLEIVGATIGVPSADDRLRIIDHTSTLVTDEEPDDDEEYSGKYLTRIEHAPAVRVKHDDDGNWINESEVRAWARHWPDSMVHLSGLGTAGFHLPGAARRSCQAQSGWLIFTGVVFEFRDYLDDLVWADRYTEGMFGFGPEGAKALGPCPVLVGSWPDFGSGPLFVGDGVANKNLGIDGVSVREIVFGDRHTWDQVVLTDDFIVLPDEIEGWVVTDTVRSG